MKSLRTRMTIMILLVVLGSSVFLSFISYQRAKSSLISQLENNYTVAAQKYALELTSWVNTNATIIDTMAAEIAVNDVSNEDYDTFHEYLRHSNELLNKNGYVYDVYFTYPDNTMVCASDFIPDGTVDFVHEREWYTTSALTGKLFYSAPYLDTDTQKPIVTISKAVYKDDKLLGVLAADIFVDVLVDKINNANVGQTSYAFLIDQKMRMIVHPNEAYAYEDKPMGVMDLEGSPYGPVLDKIWAGNDEMIFVKDYDGITRGITYSKMTNTGWYVCIATAREELEQSVRSLTSGFVLAALVAIIIGAFISIFLARALDKLNKQEQEYKEQVLKLEKPAADKASEAKSRFLADMSHEIRTPINAIIGMNEMILRETDNSDIRSYSRNIKQSGHNLLQLISGILDFSKIEDGKMEIVPARYAVRDQVNYFYNSIFDRARSKGLDLFFSIDPDIPSELFGDDTRINQIVVNLLTNAVKYTEKGSITLAISCADKDIDENKALLSFEVKDTGIGIKESDMTRLFESFERLDLEKNRNIEGTGLGMTITKKLLELMGSELKVSSVYGSGSTFSFDLWLKIENDTPLGDYRQIDVKDEGEHYYKESFHAENARILVVDDTEMNLLVITNLLKKTGIKIVTATSGEEAVNLAGRDHYDVILMDQRMPKMDGTEAMRLIRSSKDSPNAVTPQICLTADVIKGAKDRYISMGFDDYLTKPVDGSQLEKKLVKYIPEEKITQVTSSDDTSEKSVDEPVFEKLREEHVDIISGLSYSSQDPKLYKSILISYCKEQPERAENLQKSFDDKDWNNYGIYVHSIKSSSKMIGATKLYELAAASEAAAKEEKSGKVEDSHDIIMDMYLRLAGIIRECLNVEADDPQEEDDILEFDPQQ